MQLQIDQFRCSSVVAFLVILIVSPFGLVSSAGSCRGRCCKGKDVSCYSAFYKAGSIRRCYCDQFCLRGSDCCPDYYTYCSGGQKQSCEVSSWGPWSECSKKCGLGVTQRVRTIVREARHGGRPCDALTQKRICKATTSCPVKKQSNGKRIAAARLLTEIAKIIPAKFDKYREQSKYSMKTDIRKHLYAKYEATKEPIKESYCARYMLIYATKGCRFGNTMWAKKLQKKQMICVTCHEIVSNKYMRKRCPGLGEKDRQSSWSAFNVPYCNGQWIRISKIKPCRCGEDLPNSYTFV